MAQCGAQSWSDADLSVVPCRCAQVTDLPQAGTTDRAHTDIVDAPAAPVAGPSKGRFAGGYLNIAQEAGLSGRRDTADYCASAPRVWSPTLNASS
jgi:hypothetical protein